MSNIETLNRKIDMTSGAFRLADQYIAGNQPAAFMSKKSREALDDRMSRMSVGIPKLAVSALTERLSVQGFRVEGSDEPDPALSAVSDRVDLELTIAQALNDMLTYGQGYVSVWVDDRGQATATAESPYQTAVTRDPATGEIVAALKRWRDSDGTPRATYYTPENIRSLSHRAWKTEGAFPQDGWSVMGTVPNPFGVVPIVALTNRPTWQNPDGVSEIEPLYDLVDGLCKTLSDSLVTSEFYARPRRWATGIELQEDEDGNFIAPFSNAADSVWVSEDHESRFGQFQSSSMSGYEGQVRMFLQLISSVSGLPQHYLSVNGELPSADAIRSSEASLVAKVSQIKRTTSKAVARIAAILLCIENDFLTDVRSISIDPIWGQSESRSVAQSADALQKLVAAGVPLSVALSTEMGWSPEQIETVRAAKRAEAIDNTPLAVDQLLPSLPLNPGDKVTSE